jgi:hypothetical protein
VNPIPFSLIVAHYFGDWLFQTDKMALNKSKSNIALFKHVAVCHVAIFVWATWWYWNGTHRIIFSTDQSASFYFWSFTAHFCIDWVTSRINGKLWFFKPVPEEWSGPVVSPGWFQYVDGRRHWFFCMIGFDQVLHYASYSFLLWWLS